MGDRLARDEAVADDRRFALAAAYGSHLHVD